MSGGRGWGIATGSVGQRIEPELWFGAIGNGEVRRRRSETVPPDGPRLYPTWAGGFLRRSQPRGQIGVKGAHRRDEPVDGDPVEGACVSPQMSLSAPTRQVVVRLQVG